MSYNGSGTFNINTTGQPVVAGTVISSSAFNSLTNDLATGLTTAITKDGQTTTTARITFAQGLTSSLVTDSSSVSTGSIITAGGAGIAKNLYVGGIASFSAQPIFTSLTASSAVATDASKGLVSVTNTGTGNNVLATAPTIASANLTTALTLTGASGTVGQALTSGGSGNAPTWTTISSSPTAITNGTSNVTVNSSGGTITAATNGTTAITVDTSQNVGIGVTPSATSSGKAVEIGTVGNTLWGIGAADLQISAGTYYNGANKYAVTGSAVSAYELAAGSHRWYYAASGTAGNTATFSESMRIDSSGSVGIGTASPSASATRLVVKGAGTSTNTLSIFKNSADTTLFSLREDGFAYFPPTYSNTTVNAANFFINTDGALYRSTSSIKYKKNVQDSTHGLSDLMKLRSVIYEGKTEGDAGKVIGGLIAEEVNDAGLTEFVEFAPDGSPDALAYGNMVALCVKSIQELKAINDTQAETINALTARITALENA